MKRTIAGVAAAILTAGVLAGCGTSYDCTVAVGPGPTPSAAAVTCDATPTATTAPPTTAPTDDPTTAPPTTNPPTATPPPPTVEPTTPPPAALHGEDIDGTNTGPGDTTGFAVRVGGNVTTPQVWTNTIVNGNLTLRANLTCDHCVINGDVGTSSASYTVRMTESQNSPAGTTFTCSYCLIKSNNPYAKNIGATGQYGVHLFRSHLAGGIDTVYLNLFPNAAAQRTVDGHAYQATIVQTFVEYSDRTPSAHTDAIQYDGAATPTPGVLVDTSRVQGCNPPRGADWCTLANDATLGNSAFIGSYNGTGGQLDDITIRNSCLVGGNYTISIEGNATGVTITGNRFGGRRFGDITAPASASVANNDAGGCLAV